MAELRFGAARNIAFQGLPISVVVFDFLTKTADRQDTLQRHDFLLQLSFLDADFIHQIGETDKDGDSNTGIDGGIHHPKRGNPEFRKGEVNQRHGHCKDQTPPQMIQPGGQYGDLVLYRTGILQPGNGDCRSHD